MLAGWAFSAIHSACHGTQVLRWPETMRSFNGHSDRLPGVPLCCPAGQLEQFKEPATQDRSQDERHQCFIRRPPGFASTATWCAAVHAGHAFGANSSACHASRVSVKMSDIKHILRSVASNASVSGYCGPDPLPGVLLYWPARHLEQSIEPVKSRGVEVGGTLCFNLDSGYFFSRVSLSKFRQVWARPGLSIAS